MSAPQTGHAGPDPTPAGRVEAGRVAAGRIAAGRIAIDHIGIAVESLDSALRFYRDAVGLESKELVSVPQEKVRVAMLPAGEPRIELLEATAQDSPIARFLAKRGEGLHHIALKVPDLEAAVARLKKAGSRLVNEQIQTGAEGYRYVFVHPSSANGVLLELIEGSVR